MARAEEWLWPFLGPVRRMEQVKKLEVAAMLPALLPYAQQQELAKLAPVRMEVPTGSQLRLQYSADGAAPVLAVRLQEMFGLLDTPAVDGGRRPVRLHLLSPGYKPVQVTQDLRSFWGNTYAEVRKELRRRYPKHHWPEDPWTAEAVRGVPRKGKPDA
jgi:ATP-dependent helicase HrpB